MAWLGRGGGWIAAVLALCATGACAQIIGLQPFEGTGGSGGAGAHAATTGPGASAGGTVHVGSGGGGGAPATGTGAGGGGSSVASSSGVGGAPCGGMGVCLPTDAAWSGPVTFYEGVPGVACPGGNEFSRGNSDPSPTPDCTGCTCTPHTACTVQAHLCTQSNCNPGSCTAVTGPGSGNCKQAMQPHLGIKSVRVDDPQPLSGVGCTVGGQTDPAPVVAWANLDLLCALGGQQDECSLGEVCVEPPGPPFEVCLFSDMPMPCPAAYPNAHTFYGDALVSCSACSCSGIHDVDCSTPVVSFYSDATCSTPVGDVAPGSCRALIPAGTVDSAIYQPANPGSCAPQAPPIVEPKMPTYVCCR